MEGISGEVTVCRFDCGCEVHYLSGDIVTLHHCNLHSAAPNLLECLRGLVEVASEYAHFPTGKQNEILAHRMQKAKLILEILDETKDRNPDN